MWIGGVEESGTLGGDEDGEFAKSTKGKKLVRAIKSKPQERGWASRRMDAS